MISNTTTNSYLIWSEKKPTAHVTVGKQRIKQYNNVVYLDNKQKFEIELFNPTYTKILAKIKLNGEYISTSGIVLRPGERVFLQRYLDTNNSFVYETYKVDGNDKDAVEAIKKNGDVKVEFYAEYIKQVWYTHTSYDYNPTLFNTTGVLGASNITRSTFTDKPSSTVTYSDKSLSFMSIDLDKSIETGTVAKGEKTNQNFEYDYGTYEYSPFHTVDWKILPKSQQPITAQDINKKYCHNCGTKIKKDSYKFCPICGTKLDD